MMKQVITIDSREVSRDIAQIDSAMPEALQDELYKTAHNIAQFESLGQHEQAYQAWVSYYVILDNCAMALIG
jgi:hypothetical protein